MFAEIFNEALEGQLRTQGPTAVLQEMRAAVARIGRELDPSAHRECLHLVGALSQLIVRARPNAVLSNGLNRRLQGDEGSAAA